jgi:hypothetical protein
MVAAMIAALTRPRIRTRAHRPIRDMGHSAFASTRLVRQPGQPAADVVVAILGPVARWTRCDFRPP